MEENSADLRHQGEYKIIPNIPESQMDALSHGELIWKDDETTIFYPKNPLVPSSEGIHLRVESPNTPLHPKTPSEWQAWLRHWAKMIGASKVVAEGADLPDMWVSLVGSSEYTSNDDLVTDIIGRNPTGKSWGQTVPFPDPLYDNRNARVEKDKVSHLAEVMTRYFGKYWVPSLKDIKLFTRALEIRSPGSKEFQSIYDRNTTLEWPWQSEPLFVSDQAEVVAILVPHVRSGVHLMVGQPDAPQRPWHNTSKALEGLAVAEATAQVLESENYEDNPFTARTSIRATGSWFKGFMKLLDDPAFQNSFEKEGVQWKWFKRRHRGIDTKAGEGDKWTMGIGFHPHVYGARPGELMRLTSRPATEKGKDWEGIKVMEEGKRHAIRGALYRRLPGVLSQASGNIV